MKRLNIDKAIAVPTIILISIIVVALIAFPSQVKPIINLIFSTIVDKFGWLYIITCLLSFAFLLWIVFTKFGDIKLGKPDEKPAYSNFAWNAMIFTSGVGSSAVILGFIEPLYYLKEPAFNIKPFSTEAYEYAHMYGQFHWGLSAWTFYVPAIVAIALLVYKENIPALRLSVVNNYINKSKTSKVIGKIIDTFVMVAILCGISTSLGLAVPVMSNLISNIFSIPNDMRLKIFIIAIWIIIFTTSVFRGLDKGIKILSNVNMGLLILFAGIILFAGPTVHMIKAEVNTIGLMADNFIRINTWTDPFGTGEFQKMWTVFYWGWWLTFMPLMALFIVRISRGRTIRNVVTQQLIWGSIGCWSCFMVFGGYTLYLQKSGKVNIVDILEKFGQEKAMEAILGTVPFTKVLIVIFCVLLFIFLATTIDSAAYILASNSSKNLSINSQPSKAVRIFWAALLAMLSVGLLVVDELKAVQTISLIASLPMIPIQLYMCHSGIKLSKKFYKAEEKALNAPKPDE